MGTQATDEVWAVEGPEIADMPIEEPEHQVDVVNNETEELEGLEARGLPNPVEPTKPEVEWHNLNHVPHAPWGAVHVYEDEDVIVVTRHKEQKQELTANHGPTFRWITSS